MNRGIAVAATHRCSKLFVVMSGIRSNIAHHTTPLAIALPQLIRYGQRKQYPLTFPSPPPVDPPPPLPPPPSKQNTTHFLDKKMGADAECAGASPEAFRDLQDTDMGDAQLETGGGEQRAAHGVRSVMETGPQGKI